MTPRADTFWMVISSKKRLFGLLGLLGTVVGFVHCAGGSWPARDPRSPTRMLRGASLQGHRLSNKVFIRPLVVCTVV